MLRSCTPTPPSTTCTTARCCRSHLRPASCSSMPQPWPPARSTWRVPRSTPEARSRRWASPTSGVDDRVGPGHRCAGRPGRRLAGPAHRRHVPRAAGPGDPRGAERVGHQGRLPARHGRPGAGTRPLLRDGRQLDRVDVVGRRVARHRRDQRRPHRPAARRRVGMGTPGARRPPHPALGAAHDRRLDRRRRRGVGATRCAADRGSRRRSAGVARGSGVHPARPGQDHVRHGRHARSLHRRDATRVRGARPRRLLPDRRLAARRSPHVGRRGVHAHRGPGGRVVARRPRAHRVRGRVRRRRRVVRRHRRRVVRARVARPGHAGVGLRRAARSSA